MTAHYHDIAARPAVAVIKTAAMPTLADPAETPAATTARPTPAPVSAAPLEAAPARGLYRRVLKRVLDMTAVLLSVPMVLPVIAILAILVARDGGRPFYSQIRVGLGGRQYRIWKLRTMVADADARLEMHLACCPTARAEWDATQKLKNDPRITRFGRLLRKSSLDELPQLWNVLKGDMSLVGPRPMMPCQEELYPGHAYYRLRPGITGPWQVSSRNTSTFADRARFDTDYERDLSLATDLRLLAATVRVVLRATGY